MNNTISKKQKANTKKLSFSQLLTIPATDLQQEVQKKLIKRLGFRKKDVAKKAGYCVTVYQVGFHQIEEILGIDAGQRDLLIREWQLTNQIHSVQYPICCVNFKQKLD